ncbi:MAG TPA: tryptophan synthase subunit alpha [Candidatus Dormibacteraeota bacterium]|jgi:tryptophan synthase alpha chain|nr:tryptophan synthase subunit alpha [Candidatus Dormibacteraeota bacterium]
MASGERLTAALRATGDGGLPALVPYVTAGFPRRDDTVDVLRAAQAAGCAAAEIGIPFSDPLADGPTVQRAGWQALRNGMTPGLAIEQAAAARAAGVTMPLVFMTYLNPVLSHGLDRFCAGAAAAGVDGIIVPDLPADEAAEVRGHAQSHGLALIPLVAPTTPDRRIARACRHAAGFVYCVGVVGTTGARRDIAAEAFELLERVRACTRLPRAIGFGLSRHEHLVALRGRCEAVVVGSALLDAMAVRPDDGARAATAFLHGMKQPA